MNGKGQDGEENNREKQGCEGMGYNVTGVGARTGLFLWCGTVTILFFALALLVPALVCVPFSAHGSETETAWTALIKGRAVALIRHATAPGIGDPAAFRLGDCSTQRNLSGEGRTQAGRIGRFLRSKGIEETRLFSSQWCRCLETARLLGFGTVIELPLLNSFFDAKEKEKRQTEQTSHFIRSLPEGPPVVLVTHQVNITALTGVVPASGEIVIFTIGQDGKGKVLERVIP